MLYPPDVQRAIDTLYESVGRCIMKWAEVEMGLALVWQMHAGNDPVVSDTIWSALRSFGAKQQMLTRILDRKLSADQMADWRLIHPHVSKMYGKRNAIAHSTMLLIDAQGPVLKPFMTITDAWSPQGQLAVGDVDAIAAEFEELSRCLILLRDRIAPPSPHPRFEGPIDGLLQRLRSEDARTREAQRLRSLAVRQYLEQNPHLKEVFCP